MANLGKAVKGKSRAKKAAPASGAAAKPKVMEDTDYLKRLAEMQRRMLKEKLGRELAMSKMNRQKVMNNWIKIMRLAKVDEMRREVEIISQSHERDVDRKDAILQMYDRDLDEAEEQFQLALRFHLRVLDKLIELQDERLQQLEGEFEKDLDQLDKEFQAERAEVVGKHSATKLELECLVEGMSEEEREKLAEMKQEYDTTKEETRNRHVERVNVLSASLDQEIEDLQRDFEAAHLNYLHQTDSNTEEFKNLTKLDKAATKSCEVKLRLITKYQRSLEEWKTRMSSNHRDYTEKNERLAKEKASMVSHATYLKDRMKMSHKGADQRLVQLSKSAASTTAGLKERMAQAERLLVAAERCRALETEKEKVISHAASKVSKSAAFVPVGTTEIDSKLSEEEVEPLKLSDTELDHLPDGIARDSLDPAELGALANFQRKYNTVLLSKLALDRQKARLQEENANLQSVLRQYLEGISVTTDAVDKDNTLFVINGRTSVPRHAMPVREAPPTVVEANHMVATGRGAGSHQMPL